VKNQGQKLQTIRRHFFSVCLLLVAAPAATAQVIEYEANGLKFQTATHRGLTVIVTQLPNHVAGFGLIQVSISNGSQIYWTVKPELFSYVRPDLTMLGLPANQMVDLLLDRASHADVVKLVTSYEGALYGIPHMRSNNGYEQRRQNALAYGMSTRLKAAATASAIALGQSRLAPGESTDGAVFIPLSHEAKSLTGGHLVFRCNGEVFEFNPE
jgi:hypothetical protein